MTNGTTLGAESDDKTLTNLTINNSRKISAQSRRKSGNRAASTKRYSNRVTFMDARNSTGSSLERKSRKGSVSSSKDFLVNKTRPRSSFKPIKERVRKSKLRESIDT